MQRKLHAGQEAILTDLPTGPSSEPRSDIAKPPRPRRDRFLNRLIGEQLEYRQGCCARDGRAARGSTIFPVLVREPIQHPRRQKDGAQRRDPVCEPLAKHDDIPLQSEGLRGYGMTGAPETTGYFVRYQQCTLALR